MYICLFAITGLNPIHQHVRRRVWVSKSTPSKHIITENYLKERRHSLQQYYIQFKIFAKVLFWCILFWKYVLFLLFILFYIIFLLNITFWNMFKMKNFTWTQLISKPTLFHIININWKNWMRIRNSNLQSSIKTIQTQSSLFTLKIIPNLYSSFFLFFFFLIIHSWIKFW